MKDRARFAFVSLLTLFTVAAPVQARDPVSPGVGQAVLLATRSIQVDRETEILSGDLVVNDASPGPYLGEAQIALDSEVRTPAGAKVIADSVDLDGGAFVGGDVHSNTLSNGGTIAGAQITPLALPVFGVLPELRDRVAGSIDKIIPAGATQDVPENDYAMLIVGIGATARLTGTGYTFTHVNVSRGGSILCVSACNVIVRGRLNVGASGLIGPETGADASAVLIQGREGMAFGRNARITANLYAPLGLLSFDRDTRGTGWFSARDILVGRNGRFQLASAFNRPPTADAQSVFTNGVPLTITLTASDPEGQPLTFAISSPPSLGTLSALVQTSPVTATVTYTPPGGVDLQDAFTFRATDPGGAAGAAVVSINPRAQEPPPPPPATVEADDLSASVTEGASETLVLRARAPEGVALTFTIVPGTGPFHGTLGSVVHGAQATVVYTPDLGSTSNDVFEFRACGVIAGDTVCDTATYRITLLPRREELPDLASDVNVSTKANQDLLISLGFSSVETLRARKITANAAFLDPVEVAGTVADQSGDGAGDNHMPLPASVPVFMSAGVSLTGGPGNNGTVRMHFEWDISGLAGIDDQLRSATVMLNTHRGTIDSLDTRFFNVGGPNDGALTDSDFAGPAERIGGAVMEVPEDMPVGADGTFSFDVLGELLDALKAGAGFLTIQGRVDESLAGPARGLEVRTSAELNREDHLEPQLAITTPGILAPLTYTILTLPENGILLDNGVPITSVQHTLLSSQVAFRPNTGFVGNTSFQFQVSTGLQFDVASANIRVYLATCETDAEACDDGRD